MLTFWLTVLLPIAATTLLWDMTDPSRMGRDTYRNTGEGLTSSSANGVIPRKDLT